MAEVAGGGERTRERSSEEGLFFEPEMGKQS